MSYLRQYWPDHAEIFNKYNWEIWYDILFIFFHVKHIFNTHWSINVMERKSQCPKMMMSMIIQFLWTCSIKMNVKWLSIVIKKTILRVNKTNENCDVPVIGVHQRWPILRLFHIVLQIIFPFGIFLMWIVIISKITTWSFITPPTHHFLVQCVDFFAHGLTHRFNLIENF